MGLETCDKGFIFFSFSLFLLFSFYPFLIYSVSLTTKFLKVLELEVSQRAFSPFLFFSFSPSLTPRISDWQRYLVPQKARPRRRRGNAQMHICPFLVSFTFHEAICIPQNTAAYTVPIRCQGVIAGTSSPQYL